MKKLIIKFLLVFIASFAMTSRGLPQTGVLINIHTMATYYNVTGGGNYCAGLNGLLVGLSGSQLGIQYQLYYNGSYFGTTLAGTGNALNFGLQINPGTYTVTSFDPSTGCYLPMNGSVTVTIIPLPSNIIVFPYLSDVCFPGTVPLQTITNAVSPTYQWQINGTNIPGATNVSYTATQTGLYTAIVTNGFGCQKLANQNVNIYALPIAFNVGSTLNPFCQGGVGANVTLSGSEVGVSYQLQLGGVNTGLPINGTGAALSFVNQTVVGNYTITATNITTGCTQSMMGNTTLVMNPLPLAAGTITGPTTICQGQMMNYTIAPIPNATSYVWSVPAGATITGSGTSITVTYGLSIIGNVSVYGWNGCGNGQAANLAVTVYPNPNANVVPTTQTICSGNNVNISATGGGTYLWNTGSTANVISVTPPLGSTTYTVTVTGAGGCTASASSIITTNPTPIVSATPINPSLCQGQNVTLTASGATTYAWSNGANTASISVAPGSTTTYTVTGTNAFGCLNTASTTVTVNPLPIAGITGINSICQGQSTTITGTGGVTYQWNTGANTAVTSVSPTVTTPYTVTVYNASGCASTASITVVVNPLPIVTASNNGAFCVGDNIQLSSTPAGAASYAWSGPLGYASASQNPAIANATAAMTGSYFVTVTTAAGCTAMAGTTLIVSTLPSLSIGGTANVCSSNAIALSASVSNGSFVGWTGPGSYSSSVQNPTINNSTVAISGYYVATATNGGCSIKDSVHVTVNPTPTAGITGPSTICNGATATLTATGGGTYLWSTTATTATINVTPTVTTTYTVTVTGTGGCTATNSITVTVNPMPAPVFSPASAAICNGQSVAITVSGGTNFAWSDGFNGSVNTVSPTTTTTTYTVTATSGGCSATNSVSVTVYSTPTANISPTVTTICNGESAMLFATGGGTYAWSTGGINATVTVSPATTTTYTVTVTNLNGCTATATSVVTVNPAPTATISGSLNVCPGYSTTLTALGGGTYAWSTNANTQTISVSPTTLTTYTVTVTNTNSCTATADVTVNVYTAPTVNVTPGYQAICAGTNHQLTATFITGASYVWSNGQTGVSITVSPTIATNYTVTVTNTNGCTASAESSIAVNTISSYVSFEGDVSCPGGSNGYANVAVNGLYPYQYTWTPVPQNGQGTSVANNLTAGVWSVFVTDANGCTTTTSVTILEPAPIVITPSINGQTITVSVSGGTLLVGNDYQYLWSPTPTSGQFTHTATFASGVTNVQLTVTDGHNCQETAIVNLSGVGIDEIGDGSSISIYPNPVIDVLNISTGNIEVSEVKIFDATGKMITSLSGQITSLNMSEFNPGMYFIQAVTKDGDIFSSKVMKQ